jgi:hypothetical protein
MKPMDMWQLIAALDDASRTADDQRRSFSVVLKNDSALTGLANLVKVRMMMMMMMMRMMMMMMIKREEEGEDR